MTVNKLETLDAFMVIDIEDAESADGVLRCAKKVLVDSTRWLARNRTYSWALLGEKVSGASAAVNALPEDREKALDDFAAEMAPASGAGTLTLSAGRGISSSDLRPPGPFVTVDGVARAAGILACAGAAVGSLAGKTFAVEHSGAPELIAAIGEAGATVVAEGSDSLSTEADILLYGSKPALINHQLIDSLPQQVLVPTGELSLTPRALAVGQRAGKTILPDFLTTAGDRVARTGGDPGSVLADLTSEVLGHADGPVLGACQIAEEFLSTWTEVPFGRPIG